MTSTQKPARKQKTLGLALSGGGARAAFHIGVYRALEESNIIVDYVVGNSMGAIVGAGIAAGKNSSEIEAEFMKLKSFNFYSIKNFNFFRGSVLKSNFFEKILRDIFKSNTIEQFKIPFACTCIDLESREEVILDKGSIVDALMATTAFPTLFPPRHYQNAYLVDGGVVDNVPGKLVRDLGADILLAVKIKNNTVRQRIAGEVYIHNIRKKKYNIFNLKRNSQLLYDIFYETIEIAGEHNSLHNLQSAKPDILIEKNITSHILDFNAMPSLIQAGYQATMEQMDHIKKILT